MCGLWYWNVNNASSNYNATIGARPLILKWDLVCVFRCLKRVARVGGAWPDSSCCGLWALNANNASSNYSIGNGARLLIIKSLHIIFHSAC